MYMPKYVDEEKATSGFEERMTPHLEEWHRPHSRSYRRICLPIAIVFMASYIFYILLNGRSLFLTAASAFASESTKVAFTGPFARFLDMEDLPEEYKKMNLVAVWNNDKVPSYMRHFLYSASQNNDTVDLLFINRRIHQSDACIDFSLHGIDIESKTNIKVVCIGPQEWKERHIDFMCSDDGGWGCTSSQKSRLLHLIGSDFQDSRNFDLRPLQGYVYKDLFTSQRPLWAWIDVDVILGRMDLFPINLAAGLSVISAQPSTPYYSFMQGQFCVFNTKDTVLRSIWRHMKFLGDPETFESFLRSGVKTMGSEERTWSTTYFGLRESDAGHLLDYANIPELHGDDFLFKNNTAFVISGREMLMVDDFEDRVSIEHLLASAQAFEDDNVRNGGWTKGQDGSSLMINDPLLSQDMALANVSDAQRSSAKIETIYYEYSANENDWFTIHVAKPFFRGYESKLRGSLVHFKEHRGKYLFQRYEVDKRPRGFDRKLWKHHLVQKHQKNFQLPDFDLTENFVLLYNRHGLVVFEKGPNRNIDVFRRSF